jgi:hypothetical protein
MEIKEIGCEDVDWVLLAKDGHQWRLMSTQSSMCSRCVVRLVLGLLDAEYVTTILRIPESLPTKVVNCVVLCTVCV